MKHTRALLLLSLLVFASTALLAVPVAPYFTIRSQSTNAALDHAGWSHFINRTEYDELKGYSVLGITPHYAHSFRGNKIAQCLFGDTLASCKCPSIKVTGSRVANRATTDWLADYFGLPYDYQSRVLFSPSIRNFMVHLDFYRGFNTGCTEGLYMRLWAPIVQTRWDLGLQECDITRGQATSDPGYFDANIDIQAATAIPTPRSDLVGTFRDYVGSLATPTFTQTTFEPLRNARMVSDPCNILKKAGLANLHFAAGWNVFRRECSHLGLGILMAAPTGNRPKGEYLFEPIVGNGHHWEVGFAFTGHCDFWRQEEKDRLLSFFVDLNFTHLVETNQRRTFDLVGKPLSRYMLAMKMTSDADILRVTENAGTANQEKVSAVFENVFTAVANLSTIDVKVSVPYQFDAVAMCTYTQGNFRWDLGYNLYARSCEKIKINDKCPNALTSGRDWALKGDAQVFGFRVDNGIGTVALSATESLATIHKGTNNFPDGIDTIQPTRNPGVDNAKFASTSGTVTELADQVNSTAARQIKSSGNPIFIKESDLDLYSARTSSVTHKVFTNFGHTWTKYDKWRPYFGLGLEAEFSQDKRGSCIQTIDVDACQKTCGSCRRCGLTQWGIWAKGGIAYN